MLKGLKTRRVARQLTDAFPEITEETARSRARRFLTRHPGLSIDYAAEALIRGERTARLYERSIRRVEMTEG